MLKHHKLKERRHIDAETVACPVIGCDTIVDRAKRRDKLRQKNFLCEQHGIYISPSTFEYKEKEQGLLWKDDTDRELLRQILREKRESRIARENSEDALTWNVFRYLERNSLLKDFLGSITGECFERAELIYWSYSQNERTAWSWLNRARQEFGEATDRSSEPDIIIDTNQTLFFIEAKLTAGNNTSPSNPEKLKGYALGGDCWFERVFRSGIENIAIDENKYELLRFWLLGSWIASKIGKKFCLINLVLSRKEKDIEKRFGKHIVQDENYRFLRSEWELIYKMILEQSENRETEIILDYFRTKSNGHTSTGERRKQPFDLQ